MQQRIVSILAAVSLGLAAGTASAVDTTVTVGAGTGTSIDTDITTPTTWCDGGALTGGSENTIILA